MSQDNPKVAMKRPEIEAALAALSAGESPTVIAARLGRNVRTIRRLRQEGPAKLARIATPKRRKPMSAAARQRLSVIERDRAASRLPHVTAPRWSPEWFDQQNSAFALAMVLAHPELVTPGAGGVPCPPANQSAREGGDDTNSARRLRFGGVSVRGGASIGAAADHCGADHRAQPALCDDQ